jgi:protein-tyrosine kinase
MSRLYEALRRMEKEQGQPGAIPSEPSQPAEMIGKVITDRVDAEETAPHIVSMTPSTRLVALTDPKGLAAEKFRALVTRLENLRRKQELKSLQIISTGTNEGKTLIAGNLAVTLAKYSASKVLLVEGDLHRPRLGSLFGFAQLQGLSHWWKDDQTDIWRYVYTLQDTSLCILPAGEVPDQPLQILQSARFTQSFARLLGRFDWIIVDSTPMLPMADTNLWSRLVDGTLLVVREGVAPIHDLKKGLEALDHPNLLGIVLNESSSFDHADYKYAYSGYKQSENSLS